MHSHFSLRNKRGKVIKPLQYQSTVAPGTVARVEPNIKWFGKFVFFYFQTQQAQKLLDFVFLECEYLGIVISVLCGTDTGKAGKKTAAVGKGIGSHLARTCTWGVCFPYTADKRGFLSPLVILWDLSMCTYIVAWMC